VSTKSNQASKKEGFITNEDFREIRGRRIKPMRGKITPSMMCADLCNLRESLDVFEKTGIEYLHIDVMDGCFVPNIQIGTDYVRQLRKKSPIPLDIHLMITQPEYKMEWFDIQPGEYISIHYESTPHVQRALQGIRDKKGKTMLALNPSTPLSVLEDLTDDLDAVLIMTVNPGYAGQKLIPQTLQKITRLREMLDRIGRPEVEIEVDGNVSFENARTMRLHGADLFVAGSSSVFHPDYTLEEAIHKLREAIDSTDVFPI
jgi:ribulose-phosphate 3-epimerase